MFRLEMRDFASLTRWRWVLVDETGADVAVHEVELDADDWRFEAFTDLPGYLSWHTAPDRRHDSEARIVGELSEWIGTRLLGPIAVVLADAAPATVLVVVPDEARAVAFGSLGLASAGGRPLAAQEVTFVSGLEADGEDPAAVPRSTPAVSAHGSRRLRVLGLFSLPEGGRPLNLRRERHELLRLFARISADGKAVDIRVLQYGVTRDRLRSVLEDPEGWDIIHLSGHGNPGELLLETATEAPDRVTADELADLLAPAARRVGLVTISACWSAALTAAEQRRLPGSSAEEPEPARPAGSGALATVLSARLDCAVLAMRYPVDDDFAVSLSTTLYGLLAGEGLPLPRALGAVLSRQNASDLAVVTPALFGARAAGLSLAAPERTEPAPLAGPAVLPPEPDRFVGRTGVMARASAALAAESGVPGVLLCGMPGSGKTACALELAHGHEHAFELTIWYKAPDDGMAVDGALADFALTLENRLEGFQMAHLLASDNGLAGFLPVLSQTMERSRLLIVIDNAESLLTRDAEWRDPRWGGVVAALTAHTGPGRLILTSRRVPSRLTRITPGGTEPGAPPQDAIRLMAEGVDVLSAAESLLLARELPHLRVLLDGEGADPERSRRLARSVLRSAGGHPKLLELADGQAADPVKLAALIAKGGSAPRERHGLPAGVFSPDGGEEDYRHVLAAWTGEVTKTLTPDERDLFRFLCRLEEGDRHREVLEETWPELRRRLGRDGDPPDPDSALSVLASAGLAAAGTCAVHPGIAEAGRDQAGTGFGGTVDTLMGEYWTSVHLRASGKTGSTAVNTGLLVRAGLAAVPYLLRLNRWDDAAGLLEAAFVRDPTRANAAAMLPAIGLIARNRPAWSGVLAKVLAVTDPALAVSRLRTAVAEAADRGDHRAASANAGRLLDLCRSIGRLSEALDAAERKAHHTRMAGLGPWDQLADEVWRLQILASMGRSQEVLDEVARLRVRMAALPDSSDTGGEEPWHVREALLDTGRYAAMLLGSHEDSLALITEVAEAQRARRAPAGFIARTRYNLYYPLLGLGRPEEALEVLRDCLRDFQAAHDTLMIGKALSALADVESVRGRSDAAIRLVHDALRYMYLAKDVEGVAIGYHNLGDYLAHRGLRPDAALAAHLSAAVVCVLMGNEDIAESVEAAAADLRACADDAVPADVTHLCRLVGDIPGTDLLDLIAHIGQAPEDAERILADLVTQVREEATGI